jgi:hypothetical protein
VYRCVTQQRWGTYLAGRRKARQALGAGNLDGGGPQGVWEGPLVLLTGVCGALVGGQRSTEGQVTVYELSAASVAAQQRSGPSKVGQRAPQRSGHTEMTQSGADYAQQPGASFEFVLRLNVVRAANDEVCATTAPCSCKAN